MVLKRELWSLGEFVEGEGNKAQTAVCIIFYLICTTLNIWITIDYTCSANTRQMWFLIPLSESEV